jgi:hypothetical protein
MKEDCTHDEQELIFEEHDGWPCLVEVRCEACNADVIEMYSEHERAEMERDERSYQFDEAWQSAKDYRLDQMRENQ